MSKTPKPKSGGKHRAEPAPRVALGPVFKKGAILTGAAAAATGVTITGGVLVNDATTETTTTTLAAASLSSMSLEELAEREESVSRSAERPEVDAGAKAATLSNEVGAGSVQTEDLSVSDPKTLARALMSQYGLNPADFSCVDQIWTQESNWNVHADNPTSSAYGIPQALPGSKMASAGSDWLHNPETQIRWGLGYIRDRYGSACGAWAFKRAHGWY